jgi:enoyl-CoA hydratase/carnithine racemase
MDVSGFQHLKVGVEAEGRVVLLELDHGKANEMGREQLGEFEVLTKRLSESGTAVALITFSRRKSSKGTPIFVAGANVTERVGWKRDQVAEHVRWQRRVLAALRAAPVFHVAVVDGVALGWGTEFLLTCDYRIACDGAEFGLPETGLGILPGAGGTGELWAHIGVAQTLRLGMTGERVGADEAKDIGLVQERCRDVDAGLDRARNLAAMVARRSPTAVAAFKGAVLACVGEPGEVREEYEARAYEHCLDTGEAAIGRAAFDVVRAGGRPDWGARKLRKR